MLEAVFFSIVADIPSTTFALVTSSLTSSSYDFFFSTEEI